MSLTAQYHGTCTECGDPIVPGQAIEPDGDGDWRHDTCGALPDTAPCVCSTCFLVHAPSQGECW